MIGEYCRIVENVTELILSVKSKEVYPHPLAFAIFV